MDSIELQITGALDHYMPQLPPSCSSSRPGTPGDALASPTTGNSVLLSRPVSEDAGRKSKKRPITADSQQSLKSADTTSADTFNGETSIDVCVCFLEECRKDV